MSDIINLDSVYLKLIEEKKVKPKPQPSESLEGRKEGCLYLIWLLYYLCRRKNSFTETKAFTRTPKV